MHEERAGGGWEKEVCKAQEAPGYQAPLHSARNTPTQGALVKGSLHRWWRNQRGPRGQDTRDPQECPSARMDRKPRPRFTTANTRLCHKRRMKRFPMAVHQALWEHAPSLVAAGRAFPLPFPFRALPWFPFPFPAFLFPHSAIKNATPRETFAGRQSTPFRLFSKENRVFRSLFLEKGRFRRFSSKLVLSRFAEFPGGDMPRDSRNSR